MKDKMPICEGCTGHVFSGCEDFELHGCDNLDTDDDVFCGNGCDKGWRCMMHDACERAYKMGCARVLECARELLGG